MTFKERLGNDGNSTNTKEEPNGRYFWSITSHNYFIFDIRRRLKMNTYDQGIQELCHHIDEFFSDKIGTIPERELAVIAASDYCKRNMISGSDYRNTFDNLTILHVASLYVRVN
tara:strand:+ start:138 stop:479 length:342 start_codon:yes stop_codon:yes gene_type:complete